MHILFIIDPLPELKAYKDSSVAMMQALAARGHQLHVALMSDLYLQEGRVMVAAQAIELIKGADLRQGVWWREQPRREQVMAQFDAVIMRKDPPFDMEYLYATHLLERAEYEGARVFNSGAAIRNHPEKLAIAEFPEFTAPTMVSRSIDRLKQFHQEHGDVVVKPLDGMGGSGIFRLQAVEPNRSSILELLTNYGQQTIMAQRYIPEITQGDKRILIIAGQPIPYALARIPLAGETRGNLAAGGNGVAQPLSEHNRKVATAIGEKLAPRGLLLIGLDMIGNYVTEINVTSPTCFVEITQQTDFHVAEHFALALEAAVANAVAS